MTKLKGVDLSHQNPLRERGCNQSIDCTPSQEGVPEAPVCEHVDIDYSRLKIVLLCASIKRSP